MGSRKPVIGIGIEATTAYGRQIMRGITKFANHRREWIMITDFGVHTSDVSQWPTCDGIIAAVWQEATLERLQNNCSYLVTCSGGARHPGIPVVSMDDIAVGRLAAEHLLERGFKNFGYYGWENHAVGKIRLHHFQQKLAEHRFSVDASPVSFLWHRHLLPSPPRDYVERWPSLIAWLRALPKPIGIFCADDMCAFDLAAACLHADMHVPDEVAILGVNNDDLLCESAWPPLSSIECDFERVGYSAASVLNRLLKGESLRPEERSIRLAPIRVVARQSTNLYSLNEPDLVTALQYIRDHACDPCSVDDVLRTVQVTRRWLERQFSEHVGRSPYEQILYHRMKRGQELLSNTDLRLDKIALHCGFANPRHFSRQFARFTGEKPSIFRRARKKP